MSRTCRACKKRQCWDCVNRRLRVIGRCYHPCRAAAADEPSLLSDEQLLVLIREARDRRRPTSPE